jgi:hypothetical protein
MCVFESASNQVLDQLDKKSTRVSASKYERLDNQKRRRQDAWVSATASTTRVRPHPRQRLQISLKPLMIHALQ